MANRIQGLMVRNSSEEQRTLTSQTSLEDFRALYWLKAELQRFCREHGLSAAGGKREIADRIAHYLETGVRADPCAGNDTKPATARTERRAQLGMLSMESGVPAGFRCSQEARRFFVQHLGPRFRFTVTLQEYIKAHPGLTFEQVADEWRREVQLNKTGALRPEIAPQFEYNRFTRDFFADPRNAGRTRADCITAWKRARERRGEHTYLAEDEAP